MATSSFKSTSKRSTTTTSKSAKPTHRRSRSVSAFPTSTATTTVPPDEFLNKRDNPLFWSDEFNCDTSKADEFEIIDSKPDLGIVKSKVLDCGYENRGRPVSRNVSNCIGRSLSKVDTERRGRSVSQRPVSRRVYATSESEVEQECSGSMNLRNRRDSNLKSSHMKKGNVLDKTKKKVENWCTPARNSDLSDDLASASIMSVPQDSDLEDGVSVGSCWGEEIVNSAGQRIKTIQKSDDAEMVNKSVNDVSSELVNHGAVELVLDIRSECAKELEQSQERTRRLHADLVFEEHREQELRRILNEVLPEPKTPSVQQPRPRKKDSVERRKISKHLEEEAKAYFDECVSISTFDGSDFSSQEDPPIRMVGITQPLFDSMSVQHESTNVASIIYPNRCLTDYRESDIQDQFESYNLASGLTAGSSSKDPTSCRIDPRDTNTEQDPKYKLSPCKQNESFQFSKDIQKYIRNFEKDSEGDVVVSKTVSPRHYDEGDYGLQASANSLLFDRVLFKTRIESGSLLLCSGGISVSYSPFAPIR